MTDKIPVEWLEDLGEAPLEIEVEMPAEGKESLNVMNEDSDAVQVASNLPVAGKTSGVECASEEWNWREEHAKWLSLFKHFEQFQCLTADSVEYIKTLKQIINEGAINYNDASKERKNAENFRQNIERELKSAKRIHESTQDELKSAERKFNEAQRKKEKSESELEKVKQEFKSASASFETLSQAETTATENYQRTLRAQEQVREQLEKKILGALKWYESEREKICRLPLFNKDKLGQTDLPSMVWEIPLIPGVSEKIDLNSSFHEKQWTLTGEGSRWQIKDDKTDRVVMLIRRFKQKIQIEWADEIKQGFDLSVNDVQGYELVITHTIDAEHKIARQQNYPLFAIPTPIDNFKE